MYRKLILLSNHDKFLRGRIKYALCNGFVNMGKMMLMIEYLLLIILFPCATFARTFYLDATGGLDTNNGTSMETPWKTIAKVNASSFIAGDNILLKRGEEWHETMTIPSSGSSFSPLVLGAFGNGAQPIINGADKISTWAQEVTKEESGGMFSTGLEDETNAFTTDFGGKIETSGTLSITTNSGQYKNGAKGGKITFAGVSKTANAYKNFSDEKNVYARFYFKVNSSFSLDASWRILPIFTLFDATGNKALIHVTLNSLATANTMRLQCGTGVDYSWLTIAKGNSISLDTWYCVEVRFLAGTGTNGGYEVWLNGASLSSVYTKDFSKYSADRLYVGGSNTYAGYPMSGSELFFDDVKVSTTAIGAASISPTNYYYSKRYTVPKVAYRNDLPLTKVINKSDLNTTSEWWYDSTNNLIYFWDNIGNPQQQKIEVSERDYGINNDSGREYITIRNLNIQKVQRQAIRFGNWTGSVKHGITVDSCSLHAASSLLSGSNAGIYITGSKTPFSWDGINITNNIISGEIDCVQNWGVYLVQYCTNFLISGNTIRNEGEDGVTIWKSSIGTISNNTLSGTFLENCIDIKDSDSITVTKNTCSGAVQPGIVIHEVNVALSTHDIIVEHNTVTSCGTESGYRAAVLFYKNVTSSKFRYNYVYSNPYAGISAILGNTGLEISYNIIANNGSSAYARALEIGGSKEIKVWNNTIYNQRSNGAGIAISNSSPGVSIKNNIFSSNSTHISIAANSSTGLDCDYNIMYPDTGQRFTWGSSNYNLTYWKTNSGQDAHSKNNDMKFVNAAVDNFQLQSDSPAIGSGTNVSLTSDYLGNPIFGAPDIGSYEYQASALFKITLAVEYPQMSIRDIGIPETGSEISLLHKGPDNNIYGSSILRLNLFRYSVVKDELSNLGKFSSAGHEAYSMANLEGKLYIASNGAAKISMYDPQNTYHYGATSVDNPYDMGRIDDISDSPRSALGGLDGKVYFASLPENNRWGGPLSWYNPKTGEKGAYLGIAGDRSCYTLANLKDEQLLAVGTTIQGGSGTKPKVKQAMLFLWNNKTGSKIWEGTIDRPIDRPVEDFCDLFEGPDHLLYGTVRGNNSPELFVFDPKKREFISTISLFDPILDNDPLDNSLQLGPDGYIYGFTSSCLYRFKPALLPVVEVIVKENNGFSVPGPIIEKDIFFAKGSMLRAVRVF